MSKVPTKKKYFIDEETDEEIEESEDGSDYLEKLLHTDDSELSSEEKKKKYDYIKEKKKFEKQKDELDKKKKNDLIRSSILSILNKGKVSSKRNLTNLLVKKFNIPYQFRINLIKNEIHPEIAEIGGVLKRLRWENNVKFGIENGSHTFYTNNEKLQKYQNYVLDFDWRKFVIPGGDNEIYLVINIPCTEVNASHFYQSCVPSAKVDGFKISAKAKNRSGIMDFDIYKDRLSGYFNENKLVLKANCADIDSDKTLYTMIQIGRIITKETLKMNRRYSEVLKINNNRFFLPVVPIFRAKEKNAFYTTKFNNVFRYFYDFPEIFENKVIYGKFGIFSKEVHDDKFNISDFNDKIDEIVLNQVKSFLSNAIMEDWVINPAKALNYGVEDAEMASLIQEYLQDIDTEGIIKERLEEKNERNEFIKDTSSTLVLSLLGVSLLSDDPTFRWTMVGIFVVINLLFFMIRRKKVGKNQIDL